MKRSTEAAIDNLSLVWARLDGVRTQFTTVRPPHSFTVSEYAARYSIAVETARYQLRGMVRGGHLKRHRILLADDAGIMRRTVVHTVE